MGFERRGYLICATDNRSLHKGSYNANGHRCPLPNPHLPHYRRAHSLSLSFRLSLVCRRIHPLSVVDLNHAASSRVGSTTPVADPITRLQQLCFAGVTTFLAVGSYPVLAPGLFGSPLANRNWDERPKNHKIIRDKVHAPEFRLVYAPIRVLPFN